MILRRAHFRHLWRHPWQLVLSVLGIALGVAVVVAVDLANASAERAFVLSNERLAGKATHEIVGGPEGVDEKLFTRLRVVAGIRDAAPVVEGYAGAPKLERTFRLLGVAPLAEPPFRGYTEQVTGEGAVERLLTEPATGLLLDSTAATLGLNVGDTIDLVVGGEPRTLTVVGMIGSEDRLTRQALDSVILTDIATAQELLDEVGKLTRIDLILPKAGDGAALRAVEEILPAGAQILPARSDTDAMVQMTRAFRLNLTALSLLALVVGTFLIYNTMSFAVLQRRTQIGTLRALGVTRREVLRLVALEALLLGGAGTALGLPGGIALGDVLLRLVTRTINDLYFVVSVTGLTLTPLSLAKGILLGLVATTVAALQPAREAGSAPPRAVLSRSLIETRSRRLAPRAALLGVLVILLGLAVLAVPSRSLVLGFTGLFTLIVGAALLAPLFTVVLMGLLRPLLGTVFGLLGRMSARGVTTALSRTGVAIAALTVAVATTVGVAVMIDSLRNTVVHWLENTLRADIYITTPGDLATTGAFIEPTLTSRLEGLPGVAAVSVGRRVTLRAPLGPVRLWALDVPRHGFAGFDFKTGDPAAAWRAFERGAVIISEPFAYRHRLTAGDAIRLPTERGMREFSIAGVFYDYESDRGIVVMDRQNYLRLWGDPSITGLGVYAASGADMTALENAVRRTTASAGPLLVRSNRELREASMAIFERTFTVTEVLRLLAVVVAFTGILSALMAMQLERAREIAVLRAYGLTPRQIWGLVTGETGLIGLATGLLAMPLGIALALVVILVINRRSFGWTMQITVEPLILIQALLLALVAALLAGIYPALRMARTSPALALKEE